MKFVDFYIFETLLYVVYTTETINKNWMSSQGSYKNSVTVSSIETFAYVFSGKIC